MNEPVNLRSTIEPKSDQLNADDLIGTTRTVTVTKVTAGDGPDQPVSVHYEGENGRPYKPCKTMRRVLIQCWGDNGADWVGQRMTLYCDPEVKFGGVKVGGIRISHVSGIDRDLTFALTVTKAKRAPYTVKPLPDEKPSPQPTPSAELVDYPDERFSENVLQWVAAIRDGKLTTAKIEARIARDGYALTDKQQSWLADELSALE